MSDLKQFILWGLGAIVVVLLLFVLVVAGNDNQSATTTTQEKPKTATKKPVKQKPDFGKWDCYKETTTGGVVEACSLKAVDEPGAGLRLVCYEGAYSPRIVYKYMWDSPFNFGDTVKSVEYRFFNNPNLRTVKANEDTNVIYIKSKTFLLDANNSQTLLTSINTKETFSDSTNKYVGPQFKLHGIEAVVKKLGCVN